VNNKDDCLKLHHVGCLINRVMMHGATNIKLKFILRNLDEMARGGLIRLRIVTSDVLF
jgi:hypothetical protein